LKRQWLQVHEPDLASWEESDIVSQGTSVGVLARTRYPGGILVDTLDFDKALAETELLMQDPDNLVLFEPAFCCDHLRIRVDILARMGEGWSIGYVPDQEDFLVGEVKASTKIKDHQLEDVSFQAYVLGKCGYDVREVTIIHLNPEYVYPGAEVDDPYKGMFKLEPVVAKTSAWIETELGKQWLTLRVETEPSIRAGRQCSNPYPCEFYDQCNTKQVILPGDPPIDLVVLAKVLKGLKFPLYSLDFETITPGVPLYKGMKCWQPIPIQWSLHVLREPEGQVEHHEFLHDGATDPRLAFANSLLDIIGDAGSVIIYSIYERTQMRNLMQQFPELSSRIQALEVRFVDLYKSIVDVLYNKDDFGGSLSLKNIVQVLTPEVRYDDLEIRDGSKAAGLWRQLSTMSEGPEKDQIKRNLAVYCAMDTTAAYQVLRYLFGQLNERFLEVFPSILPETQMSPVESDGGINAYDLCSS
jgi:hypothetical protein